MKRAILKQLWARSREESPHAESNPVAKLSEHLRFSYLCATSKNPRALSSCIVGLSWEEAERVLRELRAGQRNKEAAGALKQKLASLEASWEAELADHQAALADSRVEIQTLQQALSRVEQERDLAQKNVETLRLNASDPSNSRADQSDRKKHASSGMARLAETGGRGRPLSGGLPGLGKRR